MSSREEIESKDILMGAEIAKLIIIAQVVVGLFYRCFFVSSRPVLFDKKKDLFSHNKKIGKYPNFLNVFMNKVKFSK